MDRTLYLNENREMTIVRDGPSLWIMMGNKAGRRVPARLISRVITSGNVKLDTSVKAIGVHLQYSVFHCSLTWPELQDLKMQLSKLINPDEDDIRIYPLPEGEKIIALGKGGRVPAGTDLFIP